MMIAAGLNHVNECLDGNLPKVDHDESCAGSLFDTGSLLRALQRRST